MKNILYSTNDVSAGISLIRGGAQLHIMEQINTYTKPELLEWLDTNLSNRVNSGEIVNLTRWQLVKDWIITNFNGTWTDDLEKQFCTLWISKCVPSNAIHDREVENKDAPGGSFNNREFRAAWCDVTPESRIDIDLAKAKEVKLSEMRDARQKKFEELGFPTRLSPELEEAIVSPENKAKLKVLRDATEPLKALNATGYNDETILEQIRQLGRLSD